MSNILYTIFIDGEFSQLEFEAEFKGKYYYIEPGKSVQKPHVFGHPLAKYPLNEVFKENGRFYIIESKP